MDTGVHRRRLILGAGVVLTAAIVLFLSFGRERKNVAVLLASGTIEATEVDVAAKISERIEAIFVREGDRMEKGQPLARLETQELDLQVEAAEARAAAAEKHLRDLVAGAREQELREAEAALAQAEANLTKAQEDWHRMHRLFEEGVVPESQRDAERAALDTAASLHQQAQERLALLRAGVRPQQIEVARAQLEEAQATLAAAKVRRSYAEITSPLSGTVLTKNMEPGEVALVGVPILTVGDLENLWVKIYVKEADLGKLKLGQKVEVTTDSFPRKTYHGTIIHTASEAEFTPKNVQTREERTKLVFAVKVEVKNVNQELKPGMMADVRIALP